MPRAPQVEFSATIRRIKARTSLLTGFRPPVGLTLEGNLQYKRNPVRCQFTTVLLKGVLFQHPARLNRAASVSTVWTFTWPGAPNSAPLF